MIEERSFGIIPLRRRNNRYEVFLVQLHAGHWGFPKGKEEPGENPIESAKRELFEETGLKVFKLLSQKFIEKYQFERDSVSIHKIVTYFAALVEGKIELQKQEVADGAWFSLQAAKDQLTFDAPKAMLERIL